MAIFHCHSDSIGKSTHDPGTAGASIDYEMREGKYSKLKDCEYREVYHFKNEFNSPQQFREFVNSYEESSRKNARILEKIEVALPVEFSKEQQILVVRDYLKNLGENQLTNYSFAIHKNEINPHCHISFVAVNEENKRLIDISSGKNSTLKHRETWANTVNQFAEKNGFDFRIDHRSYLDQGIDKIPTKHIGWKDGERRQEIIQYNQNITQFNAVNKHEFNQEYRALKEQSEKLEKLINLELERIDQLKRIEKTRNYYTDTIAHYAKYSGQNIHDILSGEHQNEQIPGKNEITEHRHRVFEGQHMPGLSTQSLDAGGRQKHQNILSSDSQILRQNNSGLHSQGNSTTPPTIKAENGRQTDSGIIGQGEPVNKRKKRATKQTSNQDHERSDSITKIAGQHDKWTKQLDSWTGKEREKIKKSFEFPDQNGVNFEQLRQRADKFAQDTLDSTKKHDFLTADSSSFQSVLPATIPAVEQHRSEPTSSIEQTRSAQQEAKKPIIEASHGKPGADDFNAIRKALEHAFEAYTREVEPTRKQLSTGIKDTIKSTINAVFGEIGPFRERIQWYQKLYETLSRIFSRSSGKQAIVDSSSKPKLPITGDLEQRGKIIQGSNGRIENARTEIESILNTVKSFTPDKVLKEKEYQTFKRCYDPEKYKDSTMREWYRQLNELYTFSMPKSWKDEFEAQAKEWKALGVQPERIMIEKIKLVDKWQENLNERNKQQQKDQQKNQGQILR